MGMAVIQLQCVVPHAAVLSSGRPSDALSDLLSVDGSLGNQLSQICEFQKYINTTLGQPTSAQVLVVAA